MTTDQSKEKSFEQRRAETLRAEVAWVNENDAWERVLSINPGSIQVEFLADLSALFSGKTAKVSGSGGCTHYEVSLKAFHVIVCERKACTSQDEIVL